jgi:hypothetical protein
MQKSGSGRLFEHPIIQASPLMGRVQDRNLKVASHHRGDFEVLNGPSWGFCNHLMALSRALKRLIRSLESLRARANSLSKGIEGLPRLAGSPLTSLQRFLTGTCLQDPLALDRPSTGLQGPYKLLTGSFYKLLTAPHRSLTSPCRRLTSLCVLRAPDTGP